MARRTSRERQERFAETFEGVRSNNWRASVERFLSRHGVAWLTDEQVEEIVSDMVGHARASQKLKLRNRKLMRAA